MIAGNLPAVQATAALILVSTLASSQLRCAAYRLLGVCVKLLLTTSVLILVSGGLAVVKPLQTTTPLFNAVSARDLSRVTELLEYAHVRLNIDVGKTPMLGMLSLNTPLHTAASTGHTEIKKNKNKKTVHTPRLRVELTACRKNPLLRQLLKLATNRLFPKSDCFVAWVQVRV